MWDRDSFLDPGFIGETFEIISSGKSFSSAQSLSGGDSADCSATTISYDVNFI